VEQYAFCDETYFLPELHAIQTVKWNIHQLYTTLIVILRPLQRHHPRLFIMLSSNSHRRSSSMSQVALDIELPTITSNASNTQTLPANAEVQPVLYPGRAGHLQSGAWSDGVCDCFNDCSIWLLASAFPWWRWSLTLSRVHFMRVLFGILLFTVPYLVLQVCAIMQGVTDQSTVGIVLDVVGILSLIFMICIGTFYRRKLRQQYQIPGNGCHDCCIYCCCYPLAIAQEARHVDRDNGFLV
jgi:Cys-rich protein (TIGR01571 family)